MRIDYEGFRKRLHDLRLARGMSQRTLSEKINKSDAYVQRLENGTLNPTLAVAVDLCYALNVSLNTLFADTFPENRFGELPILSGVHFPKVSPVLRNSLTNWMNVDGPDESLLPDEPEEPADLSALQQLGFLGMEDDMPDSLLF